MKDFINEDKIWDCLNSAKSVDTKRIEEILIKADKFQGLDMDEVAALMQLSDPEMLAKLFDTAKRVKEVIYGRRIVMFAPLYISNLCGNECLYCAFRAKNRELQRRALSQEEIAKEVSILVEQGHKRVLLVAGESYPREGFSYVLKSVDTVYNTKVNFGEIRRVNVNVAPLTTEEFKQLKARDIGTYQLFQETYHHETYSRVHLGGQKKDYLWRLTALDRAMDAGIDDVGIGVLFGLYDWRFECLALMQHIQHLETRYGVGPHTISVPRLEPATGSDIASHAPAAVSDVEFRKLVAILRLAVPYTGIIMSTRETPNLRRESFALGVSQISAGSRTNPGGYADQADTPESSQFSLGDHRTLDEVINDVASMGYIPSFCTACYRLGRTGADFMDYAKPGDIKYKCDVNALSTFEEYLMDYGSEESRATGRKLMDGILAEMNDKQREAAARLIEQVKKGKRDVFC